MDEVTTGLSPEELKRIERPTGGQVDLDKIVKDTPENARLRADIVQATEETIKRMSPPGALRLPPLLEARRLEWGVIDSAFKRQATFDRVFIWQIPEQKTETFGEGSLIVMSDQSKARLRNEAPRGILISAGLRAMDCLRSNGIELGHIVNFIQAAPWRIYIDYIAGKRPAILVMNAGDITGSEDLAEQLAGGQVKLTRRQYADDLGNPMSVHVYEDPEGNFEKPSLPWVGDDM